MKTYSPGIASLIVLCAALLGGCARNAEPLDPTTLVGSLDQLSSFRQEFELAFKADGSPEQRLFGTALVSNEPPLQEIVYRLPEDEGAGSEAESFRYVLDPELAYAELPGLGCVMTLAVQLDGLGAPASGLPQVDEFLKMMVSASYIDSRVTVNGRHTREYAFEEDDLVAGTGIESLEGQVFVDEQYGVPIRFAIDGVGAVGFLAPDADANGSFFFQVDVFDVNQPVSVSIPENCDPMMLP